MRKFPFVRRSSNMPPPVGTLEQQFEFPVKRSLLGFVTGVGVMRLHQWVERPASPIMLEIAVGGGMQVHLFEAISQSQVRA